MVADLCHSNKILALPAASKRRQRARSVCADGGGCVTQGDIQAAPVRARGQVCVILQHELTHLFGRILPEFLQR